MPDPSRKNPLGPTGVVAARRVRELREIHGWTYKELSDRLAGSGRPIPPLGLRRIEAEDRRIDADDLVALAITLGVNPSGLLFPGRLSGNIELTGAGSLPAERVWEWADGRKPLPTGGADPDGVALADFYDYSRPGLPMETVGWLLQESEEFRRRFVKRLENVPNLGGWTVERDANSEVTLIALPDSLVDGSPVLWTSSTGEAGSSGSR